MPQKCHVINCDHPVVAKGLCRKHYMRVQRTGGVDQSRPKDWGQREKHSAYSSWCNLRRSHNLNMDSSWREDFWKFVEDVGEKPNSSQACRKDSSLPWSKENFYWKESRECSVDKKEYMREWQRKSRAANPEYYLNIDYQKRYKVTYQWYQDTLSSQNGVCAICEKPETVKIKGKTIAMPVDHDHETGKARGLLCSKCNRALGLFGDDEGILKSAINYLKSHM